MDNSKYYENFDWSTLEHTAIKTKIEKILKITPLEVKTIIDIGCGNGIITNALSQKFKITGVDRSKHALESVKTDKIQASAESIPVDNNSFDMVISSELLEHLPDDIFEKTINEFKRISKKYILISVPDNENLKKNAIQCPMCKFIYNRSYHLRSFSINDWEEIFPEYKMIKSMTLGVKHRHYHSAISTLKQKISPPNSWIPYYLMPKNKRNTLCPNCEYKFEYGYKFNLLSFICDMLNIIVSLKRPYWQMILLKKTI